MFKPLKDSTLISDDNHTWRPKTFPDFLEELDHLKSSIPDVCFFRGQARSDYLLDSTFSRKMKEKRGVVVTERYSESLRTDMSFQYTLAEDYLNYLHTVPVLQPYLLGRNKGLSFNDQVLDLIYEYHVHVQQDPDDPNLVDYTSLGTNFLDFTYDQKVGIFFANRDRLENNEGALFIVRQKALGPVFHDGDFPAQEVLILLQGEIFGPRLKEYNGLPRFPWPAVQSRSIKVKRQNAVYIAQMDFRYELEFPWKYLYKQTHEKIFIKLILPTGTVKEVQEFLIKHGMTEDFLFPNKKNRILKP